MREIVSGRIRSFDEENRIMTLHVSNKIRYFYMQRSLLNLISKFIEIGRFIQFTITEDERLYKNHKVNTVDYVIKIMEIRYRKNITYYSMYELQQGTKKMINDVKTKMFLDLEMSMHPYKVDKKFVQEIIQVGYLLVDENDNVLEEYNEVIKPTIHKKLTKRTLKFLEITQDDVDQGIDFKQFYDHFRQVVIRYNPAIVVWGRNDFLAMRQGYTINKLPSLKKQTRYINLLKLHKNYFNLKNDIGLFNALKLYQTFEEEQAHNALEDAKITSKIFYGFKDAMNLHKNIDTSHLK